MLYSIALLVGLKHIASNNTLTSISTLESRFSIAYQTLVVNDELMGDISCTSWFLQYILVWMFVFTCTPFLFEGFPNEPAAEIALKTARSWVKRNQDKVSDVGFLSRSPRLPLHLFKERGEVEIHPYM